jgi:hypothetical protein
MTSQTQKCISDGDTVFFFKNSSGRRGKLIGWDGKDKVSSAGAAERRSLNGVIDSLIFSSEVTGSSQCWTLLLYYYQQGIALLQKE